LTARATIERSAFVSTVRVLLDDPLDHFASTARRLSLSLISSTTLTKRANKASESEIMQSFPSFSVLNIGLTARSVSHREKILIKGQKSALRQRGFVVARALLRGHSTQSLEGETKFNKRQKMSPTGSGRFDFESIRDSDMITVSSMIIFAVHN
jgi:hypothetical protein